MSVSVDAEKHLTKAKRASKFSWVLNWFPDNALAAHHYEQAAKSFEAVGNIPECIRAWDCAAESYQKASFINSIAKTLECPAQVLQQVATSPNTPLADRVEHAKSAGIRYEKAAKLYREDGNFGKAATCFTKKASCMINVLDGLPKSYKERSKLEDEALGDMVMACQVLEETGQYAICVETFRTSLTFAVKLERWKYAIDLIDKFLPVLSNLNQTSSIYKMRLSKVVLALKQKDQVAATNAFRAGFDDQDYLRSSECAAAEDLIAAWDNGDSNAINEVLKRQIFNFLDRQVTIVAHTLIPENTGALRSTINCDSEGASGKFDTSAETISNREENENFSQNYEDLDSGLVENLR